MLAFDCLVDVLQFFTLDELIYFEPESRELGRAVSLTTCFGRPRFVDDLTLKAKKFWSNDEARFKDEWMVNGSLELPTTQAPKSIRGIGSIEIKICSTKDAMKVSILLLF